jgi:hypothetical protein
MNTKKREGEYAERANNKGEKYKKMGWLTGIEPATTGITIRGSTN